MALEQKLQLKLSQKLILTPALQQAIKLLPMATLKLVDVLNQEVVENPLLEEMSPEELQQTDEAAQVDKADPDPQPTRDTQDTWDDADGTPGKTRTCDPRLRRPRIAFCVRPPVPYATQRPSAPAGRGDDAARCARSVPSGGDRGEARAGRHSRPRVPSGPFEFLDTTGSIRAKGGGSACAAT